MLKSNEVFKDNFSPYGKADRHTNVSTKYLLCCDDQVLSNNKRHLGHITHLIHSSKQ